MIFPHAVRAVAGALRGLAIAVVLTTGSLAQDTTVAPFDLVSLKVLDWDPVESVVREWPALSGEYRIDANGVLSVPFIAPMYTNGLTLQQMSTDIAEGLRDQFALRELPEATLEIVNLPTIIVGGLVRNPGVVEFRNGMTVRHAIVLAGGLDDTLTPGTDAFRSYVANQGQLQLLVDRIGRQYAVLARLEAERSNATRIAVPAMLDTDEGRQLILEQAELLQNRRADIASDLDAISEQIELFRAEIASLEQRVIAIERQRTLAQDMLDNAQRLVDQGLVRRDGVVDAEQQLITVENQLLDTSTAILRARQAVSFAVRERETIVADRRANTLQQILDLRAQVAENEERILTTTQLLNFDAESVAVLQPGVVGGLSRPEPVVTLYRSFGTDEPQEISDLGTVLSAGDLIDVGLHQSDQNEAILGVEGRNFTETN